MNCEFSDCKKENPPALYRVSVLNKAARMAVTMLLCSDCYERLAQQPNLEVGIIESRKSEESLWIPKLDLTL